MTWFRLIIAATALAACSSAGADVLVDDMEGNANKTLSGGYVFDISSAATSWEWPNPALAWTYWDLADDGNGETGQVARVAGTLGDSADYPFIGYGSYLTQAKDTLDLSQQVTAFAFRARGQGFWRFKYKNKLIDSLAVKAGKTDDQVAWMMPITPTEEWQWFVLPVDQFSANVGDVNTLFDAEFQPSDPLTSIYKVYWQTDGYTSADGGTAVSLDVDDFMLLGSIQSIGRSTQAPTAAQCDQINAVAPGSCGGSPVRQPLRYRGKSRAPVFGFDALYSVDGRRHTATQRAEQMTGAGVFLIAAPGGRVYRTSVVDR